MNNFDVIVIGAGPAGYVAAIRCAQLGLRTACVDDWLDDEGQPTPGGTCLNVGCIPSKALLQSSELYQQACDDLAVHGIRAAKPELDLATLLARKQQVVSGLTSGIASLFEANQITLFSGWGRLLANKQVQVSAVDGSEQQLEGRHIVLAPGSRPRALSQLPFDGHHIVDSSGALCFDPVPARLAVIGAGIVGLELGSVWQRLGAEVTLFKSGETFLPAADQSIARQAQQMFSQQGLIFCFGSEITTVTVEKGRVSLQYRDASGKHQGEFDKVLVAVGRVPNTQDLVDDAVSLNFDKQGFIAVDQQCRTNQPDIYAIGDAVRGPMLAHKGSEEGAMVAALIAGRVARVDYANVPFVIYTRPEIAWCGQTEQALKQQGVEYHVGSFSFGNNARARATGEIDGQIKILTDANDRILGVHMIGPHVSELIGQAVLAMTFAASSEDLALTMFAHPSLSETLHEAAQDVNREAIHKYRGR